MTPEQLSGLTDRHLIPLQVGTKSFLVHPQVSNDLMNLIQAAKMAGFDFHIASGFRTFERQCSIWNRKFSGALPILDQNSTPLDTSKMSPKKLIYSILRWSALPGASRHHWGTDFDVYCHRALGESSLRLEPWEYQSGHQAKFSNWLRENLETFGFFLPYRLDIGGVSVEPWHISHRKTSTQCLAQLTVEKLDQILAQQHVLGKDTVRDELKTIYNRFILGISQ
jgi:LAS superfamily LD-carboxypeptidase LdcB